MTMNTITWVSLVEKKGLDAVLDDAVAHSIKLSGDLRERYHTLFSSLMELRTDLEDDGSKPDEMKIVNQLHTSANILDTDCGTDVVLSPDMSLTEHFEAVGALDADREDFKELLRGELKKNQTPGARKFLLEWARLLFGLNGYVAPPRATQAEAERDAAGKTDLFAELLEELEAADTKKAAAADIKKVAAAPPGAFPIPIKSAVAPPQGQVFAVAVLREAPVPQADQKNDK